MLLTFSYREQNPNLQGKQMHAVVVLTKKYVLRVHRKGQIQPYLLLKTG